MHNMETCNILIIFRKTIIKYINIYMIKLNVHYIEFMVFLINVTALAYYPKSIINCRYLVIYYTYHIMLQTIWVDNGHLEL